MHKATGEAGPVLSTQSSLVTGAATMHYPAVIDRVGLCGLGHGSDGALSSWLHFMLPVGKRKLCRDWCYRAVQKCYFFAHNVKVIFPIS